MFRYKKLGYIALSVTDVEKSSSFYQEVVGLDLQEKSESGEYAFLRCSNDHHNLILHSGQEPGLQRIGFELEDENQMEMAFEAVTKAGLDPKELGKEETYKLHQGRTFRFRDPYVGIEFEMYNEIMQMGQPYQHKLSKIEKLGHVVIETSKFDELLNFLLDTLNFKVSDYSGNKVGWAWLRAFPNPLHHSLGLVRGEEDKMNHIAFNVEDIDDIGKARNLLLNNDIPILFGPGRHAPSGSIFLYFPDPDGLTLEYSQGMEEFPEKDPRKPRRLEPSLDTLDQWGGRPDPGFGAIGKIITNDD